MSKATTTTTTTTRDDPDHDPTTTTTTQRRRRRILCSIALHSNQYFRPSYSFKCNDIVLSYDNNNNNNIIIISQTTIQQPENVHHDYSNTTTTTDDYVDPFTALTDYLRRNIIQSSIINNGESNTNTSQRFIDNVLPNLVFRTFLEGYWPNRLLLPTRVKRHIDRIQHKDLNSMNDVRNVLDSYDTILDKMIPTTRTSSTSTSTSTTTVGQEISFDLHIEAYHPNLVYKPTAPPSAYADQIGVDDPYRFVLDPDVHPDRIRIRREKVVELDPSRPRHFDDYIIIEEDFHWGPTDFTSRPRTFMEVINRTSTIHNYRSDWGDEDVTYTWDHIKETLPTRISMDYILYRNNDEDRRKLLPSKLFAVVTETSGAEETPSYYIGLPPVSFLHRYTDDVLDEDWKDILTFIFPPTGDLLDVQYIKGILDIFKSWLARKAEADGPFPFNERRPATGDLLDAQYIEGIKEEFNSWLDRKAEAAEDAHAFQIDFERRLIEHVKDRGHIDGPGVNFETQNAIIEAFPRLVHDIMYYELSSDALKRNGLRRIIRPDGHFAEPRQGLVAHYNGIWKGRLMNYCRDNGINGGDSSSSSLTSLFLKAFFYAMDNSRYIVDDPHKRLGAGFRDLGIISALFSSIVFFVIIEKEDTSSPRFESLNSHDAHRLAVKTIADALFEFFDTVKVHPTQLEEEAEVVDEENEDRWKYSFEKWVNYYEYYRDVFTEQRNDHGQNLFHALLENGLPGHDILLKKYPGSTSVSEVDPRSGFFPFQLAALPRDVIYDNINSYKYWHSYYRFDWPEDGSNGFIDDDENWIPDVDVMTVINTDDAKEAEAIRLQSSLEREQLSNIYNLLRADPTSVDRNTPRATRSNLTGVVLDTEFEGAAEQEHQIELERLD